MLDNELLDLLAATCDSLNQQKCVLVLGPDIYINEMGTQVWEKNEYLATLEKDISDCTYFPNDGVLKFADKDRFKIQQSVKKFFSGSGDVQLLESISAIRFPLIINASPDESLFNYLHDLDPDVQFDYFEGEEDENKSIAFDRHKPLIYNIFGKASDPQSLIISHDILYRKMQELLPVNSFPGCVRDYLQKANSILFVGFRYDSWAYQLLSYKVINQKVIDKEKIRLSSSRHLNDNIANVIMTGALGMSFTDVSPLQILNDLIKIIKSENYNSLLRDVGKQDKFSTFISYSRRSGQFIQNLIERFNKNVESVNKADGAQTQLRLLYDKEDFYFGQSIDSFMTRIGRGKTVLLVINDSYLKSEYCMVEALRTEIYHENNERIFMILITNDLHLDFKQLETSIQYYQDYWEGELANLTEKGKKADKNKVLNYLEIRDFIPEFIRKISEYNNYVTDCENVVEADLDNFILQLINKMKEE
jgi:hypothetical protein